jgi:membrane-bound lytic murein transglycosylase B
VTRAWICALGLALAAPGWAQDYAERPEARAFIREMVERHGFVQSELAYMFSRVRRVDPVLQAIQLPAEKSRSWQDYRATFLEERRVDAGAAFWKAHRKVLERAERAYGVPPEYVVAIIGIETFYGRHTGRWRVVDALTTLAFDYPPRAEFFRRELEHYLLLARDSGVDVFSIRGSYAGAIGMPQFMPGSTRRYGVDFDGDGAVDLRRNVADAIGSVANFLKQHGWRRGGEVLLEASVSGEGYKPYADGGLRPKATLAELARAGVRIGNLSAEREAERAVLIELEMPGRPSEFRVGLHNFYVLTRYNSSAFYAAAVADLAQALRERRRTQRVGR